MFLHCAVCAMALHAGRTLDRASAERWACRARKKEIQRRSHRSELTGERQGQGSEAAGAHRDVLIESCADHEGVRAETRAVDGPDGHPPISLR